MNSLKIIKDVVYVILAMIVDDSDDDDNGGYGGYGGYDDWGASLVDSKFFPGFKEFYNIFTKIFDQLNYNRFDCESDSEIEIESDSE